MVEDADVLLLELHIRLLLLMLGIQILVTKQQIYPFPSLKYAHR
jgi:hypothetical protein